MAGIFNWEVPQFGTSVPGGHAGPTPGQARLAHIFRTPGNGVPPEQPGLPLFAQSQPPVVLIVQRLGAAQIIHGVEPVQLGHDEGSLPNNRSCS